MNTRMIVGLAMIVLGVFLFLNRGAEFGIGDVFAYFWPSIFIIPLGLLFHWMYFSVTARKGAGMLIPGGVLITVGIVCQVSMLFDIWHLTWPGFILAPAVGLFEYYWFGGRNKWLLIPINILTVLSMMFFAVFYIGAFMSEAAGKPFAAVLLILLGVVILFSRKKEANIR